MVEQIGRSRAEGHAIVVVASAMGRAGEIARAHQVPLRIRPLLSDPDVSTEVNAQSRCPAVVIVVNALIDSCARVSVVGSGLQAFPDAAAYGAHALGAAGVRSLALDRDGNPTACSWIVPLDSMAVATQALHHCFVEQHALVAA